MQQDAGNINSQYLNFKPVQLVAVKRPNSNGPTLNIVDFGQTSARSMNEAVQSQVPST